MHRNNYLIIAVLLTMFLFVPFSLGAVWDDQLILYEFENNLQDTGSAGNNEDLTDAGSITYNATGKIEYSAIFEQGDTDYLTNTIDGTTANSIRTISCWFKPETVEASDYFIQIYKGASDIGADRFDCYISSNAFRCFLSIASSVKWNIVTTNTFSVDTWAMWTLTMGANGTKIWFNDGPAEGSDVATDVIPSDFTVHKIGARVSQGNYLDGELDNCIYDDDIWTEAEITQAYNSGNGVDYNVPAPFTNSSWNITSGNVQSGYSSIAWRTGLNTSITSDLLSFSVATNYNSNMSCRLDVEQNYTEMVNANASFQSATTNTTSHAMTIPETISDGSHCLYCSFKNDDYETSSGVSSSGCLSFSYGSPPSCDLISPLPSINISGVNTVEWSASDTSNFVINVTLVNSSDTLYLGSNLVKGTTSLDYNFSAVPNGRYNLTIVVKETGTLEGFSCSDGHVLNVSDIHLPLLSVELLAPSNNSVLDDRNAHLTYSVNNASTCYIYLNGVLDSTESANLGENTYITGLLNNATQYSWNVFCTKPLWLSDNSSLWYFNTSYDTYTPAYSHRSCPVQTGQVLFVALVFGLGFALLLIGGRFMPSALAGMMGFFIVLLGSVWVIQCSAILSVILVSLGFFGLLRNF